MLIDIVPQHRGEASHVISAARGRVVLTAMEAALTQCSTWEWCLTQQLMHYLGCLHPRWECSGLRPGFCSEFQLSVKVHPRRQQIMTQVFGSLLPMEDMDGVSRLWLWLGPAPAVVGI